jgi:hypothetical protein
MSLVPLAPGTPPAEPERQPWERQPGETANHSAARGTPCKPVPRPAFEPTGVVQGQRKLWVDYGTV